MRHPSAVHYGYIPARIRVLKSECFKCVFGIVIRPGGAQTFFLSFQKLSDVTYSCFLKAIVVFAFIFCHFAFACTFLSKCCFSTCYTSISYLYFFVTFGMLFITCIFFCYTSSCLFPMLQPAPLPMTTPHFRNKFLVL